MREVRVYMTELNTDTHAAQHAAGRALLRRALADAGLSPDLAVCADANGKPYLPDAPGFHFSIAHSGARAVCAVSDMPLGCDLERERVLKHDISRRVCTDAERAALRTNADLFALWTGKEAAVKAVGLGLRLPPASFAVGLAETASLTVGGTDCVLRRLPPENGWHLAVCTVGREDFCLRTIPTVASQPEK
ncbi:MAG: 4'-phosphopantetheinyl transferase superfamily protein [Butyricicoccus sp.]|nr:4'-phosphopantetheinyl transferase superfamily protein [Butyricicoccus sp.]